MFFTKYTLFAEKMFLYGKVFFTEKTFFTEKNINEYVKNIHLIYISKIYFYTENVRVRNKM